VNATFVDPLLVSSLVTLAMRVPHSLLTKQPPTSRNPPSPPTTIDSQRPPFAMTRYIEETPCPVRSNTSASSAALPMTSSCDDDTDNIDFTKAFPDIDYVLSRPPEKKQSKGLKEPPRRTTNHVPKPERYEKAEPKEPREVTSHVPTVYSGRQGKLESKEPPPRTMNHVPVARQEREVPAMKETKPIEPNHDRAAMREPPRRFTSYTAAERQELREESAKSIAVDADAEAVELPVEPWRRPQGLQQLPQRSLIRGTGAMGSRRRVSALLKANSHTYAMAVKEDHENKRPLIAHKSQGQQPLTKKPALGEKSRNTPSQSSRTQVVGEKKQLLAPPKRLPLQLPKKPQQHEASNNPRERQGGKENMPLCEQSLRKRALAPGKLGKSPVRKSVRMSDDANHTRPDRPPPIYQPAPGRLKGVPKKRTSEEMSYDDNLSLPDSDSSYNHDSSGSLRLRKRTKTSITSLPSPPSLTQEEEAELILPDDFLFPAVASSRPPTTRRPLDPVLTDDLERCEMYEESWLSAQESSVSQLLNRLLVQYSPVPVGKPRLALRREFIAMYSSAPFPMIYNRVHASLLYGALSITQHVLDKSSSARVARPIAKNKALYCGWGADVGMREKFMELFMRAYEQSALATALEVVIGREMFVLAQTGESEKKTLESYIERYLVNSEDLLTAVQPIQKPTKLGGKIGRQSNEDEDRGTPAWLLRRSLLRSFILILLLDKAKSRGILGKQCLFKKVYLRNTFKGYIVVLTLVGISIQIFNITAKGPRTAASALNGRHLKATEPSKLHPGGLARTAIRVRLRHQ
jgi:hypothetical protein